jgi:hypothetical protein
MVKVFVFYPPRIMEVDSGEVGNIIGALNKSVDDYMDKSVCILVDSEGFLNAKKVCNFYRGFKDLQPPT